MKYSFNCSVCRRIYQANRMACRTPVPHPTRILGRHDLLYILSGSYTVEVCNRTYHASKDHVLILPAGILHEGVKNCDADTQTLWLLMEKEAGDCCISYSDDHQNDGLIPVSLLIDASDHPNIRKYFEKLLLSHINGDKNRASAFSTLLLCELYDADQNKNSQLLLAESIKKKIDININVSISNADIARSLGKSIKTVESAFKKTYGLTIHNYALREKLKQGRIYLENFPYMSLRDIAESLGFYDEYHFSRQFKRGYGMSPTEYKKNFFSVDRYNFSTPQ